MIYSSLEEREEGYHEHEVNSNNIRDLNTPRDYPLVLPTKIDEVVVFGGGTHKTAELRSWNPQLGDYEFKPFKVTGEELIESPNSYDSALPTFMDVVTEKESFPNFAEGSRLIFGNEIDCFVIELTKDLTANFYKSPMKLQQKTGQNSVRTDKNTIYLAGGTDTSRTKISSKTYRFLFSTKEVTELAKLNIGRYFPVMVRSREVPPPTQSSGSISVPHLTNKSGLKSHR